jgi:hypothetical protein
MPAIERLADAMEAESIFQIRRWFHNKFTVELNDGRTGFGTTPRAAIKDAQAASSGVAA